MSQRRRISRALRPVVVARGEAHVYLEGPVGFPKEGGITSAQFREQLARCEDAKVIYVHINSPGGVVTEGMRIYAALRAHPARKVGIVEGICASIATVSLMGCDERKVAKGSFIMIHNPSTELAGEASDLRKSADNLDRMRGEMLDIYEGRTGIERAKLEKLLDDETYFTAEEAVELGIADEVDGAFEAKVDLRAVARLNAEKVPAALRALATKGKVMKGKNAKMKALEEEMAALKARAAEDDDDEPEEETDEDETEEETDEDDDDKPKDQAAALVAMVVEVTGTKDVSKATAKLAGMLSSAGAATSSHRAAQVAAAIKAGKLLPALKSWALKASESQFKTFIASVGGSAILKMGGTHKQPEATKEQKATDPAEPTADELRAGKAMGLSREQIIAARKQTMIYGGGVQ